jgi:hypothetical protein
MSKYSVEQSIVRITDIDGDVIELSMYNKKDVRISITSSKSSSGDNEVVLVPVHWLAKALVDIML